MIVNNTSVFSAIQIADLPAGGTIGVAASTVDIGTAFHVNQTTANQTVLLPSPTISQNGYIAFVVNTGTASFEIDNIPVAPNKGILFQWDSNEPRWIPFFPTYTPGPAMAGITVVKAGLFGTVTSFAYETQTSSDAAISTYAWSGTGVTFATPAASASTYTVATPGSYTISLSVTNASGIVETYTRDVKHDRALHVLGYDSEEMYFATISDAYTWLTASGLANPGQYRVYVWSTTADTGQITLPNVGATIIFKPGATVTCSFNLGTAGTKNIIAESSETTTITGSAGFPAITAAGANLTLIGISIASGDATQHTISMTGGAFSCIRSTITQLSAASAGVYAFNGATIATLKLFSSTFIGSSYFGGASLNNASRDAHFQSSSVNSTFCVHFDGCSGRITNIQPIVTSTGAATVGSFSHVLITKNATAGNSFVIDGISVNTINTVTAANYSAFVEVTGAGTSTLYVKNLHAQNLSTPTGAGYGILRNGAPTATEWYVDGFIRCKTAAFINLIAGVATAWNPAPIYGFTLHSASPDASVGFGATVAFGSNVRV